MIRIFFYIGLYFFIKYLGIEISLWLTIFGAIAAEILFSRWNRRQRITSTEPEHRTGSLIALLRIRSAEIGAMYHTIRSYQIQAGEGSWIPLFIAEYRSAKNYSIYQEPSVSSKQEEKYRKKAHALYNKRFSYDPFYGVLNEPELIDTGVAMLCWTSGFNNTIRLLQSIQCDANLRRHIRALLRQYQLIQFLTLNGNYHILFKNWRPLSSLVRERYRLLRQHWEEVWFSHQYSVLTTQAASHLNVPHLLDDIWTEGQILANMERNLGSALSQENDKSFGWGGKDEVTFFQRLESNPIWTKLYGYGPYPFPKFTECPESNESPE